ncbi:hypothetical protein KQI52_06580 [bacterium]|nr:hypothetical protein [bacterium]
MSPAAATPPPSGSKSAPHAVLSDDEKALVRAALQKAFALPDSLSEEEHVKRVLRIRNQLEENVLKLSDYRIKTRPWLIGGWLVTTLLGLAVVGLALWRAFVRYESPIPALDDPMAFLLWFGIAFVVAWLPVLIAWLRARSIRIRIETSEVPDAGPALTAFDVAIVRRFIRTNQPG